MTIKRSTKFMLGIGLIVFAAVGSMSLFFYHYVKNFYIDEIYRKTDLVLGHIDATIEYVKDELRPKMFHVLPKDDFVLEAMSTSFVNKGVMTRFSARFPDYRYRRVAVNPMNPMDQADTLESGFIDRFSRNPQGPVDWKGLVTKGQRKYFIHLKGVRMEKQCAVCHGRPADSPKSLLERYGGVNGHNWSIGDIVGLESIAIPVDATFFRIRQVAFSIFLIGLTGVAALTLFLYYFYYLVTQRPLQKASSYFKSIVSGEKGLDVRFEVKGQDEISELADSFNGMIDHLRHSQAELMTSESKYRRIFEGSKDAIVVASADGLVLDINAAGLDLLGIKDQQAVAGTLRLHDIFESAASLEEFLALLARAGFVKDYETGVRTRHARNAQVLISATYADSGIPKERAYECIIKDITERKAMERQLRQADKLASIGQLAAGVAHEINNPLSIVIGYTKMLRQDVRDAAVKEDLDIVFNNAGICKRIVDDLLNFARQTKTQQSRVDIHGIIESVLSVVESNFNEDGVSIHRDFDPQLPQVTVDVDKMRQVFMNLIMNAYQAISQNGRITISTRSDVNRGGFRIAIADTGCGIPADILDAIFDPFFTTKEPGSGTGLGLTVSYGIIEEHNGAITVDSEIGRGTTFEIWLPLGAQEDETGDTDRR